MKDLEEVRKKLYEWQAKNPIVCYYDTIPLHKFTKFDLIVLVSKLMDDSFNKNEN